MGTINIRQSLCIICHQKHVEASDEHIIPKAIGGYLHTWNVCKTCNSTFGDHIDKLLINQHLIKHERYKHKLKGQSNQIVDHPFTGVFKGEDGKQYKIEEKDGVLTPHIIGAKPTISEDGTQMSLTIDARDSKQIKGIVEKYCKRNKLQMPDKLPDFDVQKSPAPAIQVEFSLNFNELKLAMLKIAYEFTACLIPNYVSDRDGLIISDILREANPKRVAELEIGENILKDEFIQRIFGPYLEFTKDTRHYILLANVENKLICCVKLFNLFCTAIVMAHHVYDEIKEPIIVINDFGENGFEIYTLSELLLKNSMTQELFKLIEPYHTNLASWNMPMGFCCDKENRNLCFDLSGHYIGTIVDLLDRVPDNRIESVYEKTKVKSIFHIQGAVCFMLNISSMLMLVPIDEIILETNFKRY